MIPTVANVFDAARAHLGDTQIAGGQIATDSLLVQYWPNAYNSLYRWLDRNANKTIRRTTYYNLPANTAYMTPASFGVPNMGKPQELYDRAIGSTFTSAIAGFNSASLGVPPSVQLTVTAHGLSSGAQVVAFGFDSAKVSDDINGQWYIGVVDANTIKLLGCSAVDLGGAAGSQGIISTGAQVWPTAPLPQVYDIDGMPLASANAQLGQWKWENGAFWFVPSSSNRQVKIVFMLSGSPPASGSVGIDDSMDALSLYLAGALAAAKGLGNKSQSLFMRAVGNPSGDTTMIRGGAFYELAQLGLQALTMTRIIQPRYRPRRNVGPLTQTGGRW